LEVFLEAVGLEEIGEFESADVAVLGTDLPLKIEDDGAQILEGVAQTQQFIPHPFPVESQAHILTGELAIELMGLVDGGGVDR
jgi:NifB/MoaA-like Fe-S oxidoreductase